MQVLVKEKEGLSRNKAIAAVLPKARRSWAIHRLPAYQTEGIEALIDKRLPRAARVSGPCREVLATARMANPKLSVEEARGILAAKDLPQPSDATLRREFRRIDRRLARDAPPPPPAPKPEPLKVIELPLAGGELLLAAEHETGGIAALTAEVVRMGEWAREVSQGQTPTRDVERRDWHGRFTPSYNRARRRKRGEAIASYLRPAADKGEGRVPTWARFVHERAETIDAKLRMIVLAPLVAASKGWDALRAPDFEGLAPLATRAYMPATLAKLVSALAISGASGVLLDAMGRRWHEVASARWQEAGAIAAFFVDNHAKEVWSKLFTQAGLVAHRSRIMPCITTTYVHTGAGTPLVLSVQSGAAPLAPRFLDLLEGAEALCGDEVRRAVVVDAEGSTFDILAACQERGRVIVTPLRPARAPELELRYSPGSYYRPYRESDELRVARCTLVHRSTGRRLDLGALLIRRQGRENETVLLTTGLDADLEGRSLADLYFLRWPLQENSFKEAAVLGLNQHRGNCGRMVANVTVVTKLERLEVKEQAARTRLAELVAEATPLAKEEAPRTQEDRRAQKALATRRRRLDVLIGAGKTAGKTFARVAVEHQQALVRAEAAARAAAATQAALAKNRDRRAGLERQLIDLAQQKRHLEPQRTIRQLDVEQDMILTATKLTAAQLIAFAVRQYMPSVKMTAETFVTRVFTLRGRKELRDGEEKVVFYENARDAEITHAIREACRHLNALNIVRDKRAVRYAVETPRRSRGRSAPLVTMI